MENSLPSDTQGIRQKFVSFTEKLNRSQKWYLLSAWFLICNGLWCVITLKLDPDDLFLIASAIFMLFGVLSDLSKAYDVLMNNIFGKAIMLLVFAAATTITYALSSATINDIIQFDVVTPTYTINIVAILSIPTLTILGLTALFPYAMGGALVLYPIYMSTFPALHPKEENALSSLFPKIDENFPILTYFVRVIVIMVILITNHFYGQKILTSYINSIETPISWLLYNIEAVRHSRCTIPKNTKVLKVNDNEIVIVEFKNGSYTFTPSKCTPIIKQ